MSAKYIDLYEYLKGSKIGEGSFGRVFEVRERRTNQVFAAKISYREIRIGNKKDTINIQNEINIMSKLDHPTILKFIGYSPINYSNHFNPVIITEYASNGSLLNIINKEKNKENLGNWNSTKKLICIYGIANGMSYLHEHKIVHRDLKSSNILMNDKMEPKIADFGFSKSLFHNNNGNTYEEKCDIKGTPSYIAPEIWEEGLYTEKSDVYSFGLIVYNILTQKSPFEKVHWFQIKEMVLNGERPKIDESINDVYAELIQKCWQQDYNNRPTFEQIVTELHNEPRYITPDLNEKEFRNYIKYIDNCQKTFNDSQDQIDIFNSLADSIDLSNIDNKYQQLIIDAKKDPAKQFIVGKFLIEGKENFPINYDAGIKYIEKSISSGYIEAVIYYCNILMKKNMSSSDINDIKKRISKYLSSNEPRIDYLYGKLLKKQKKYSEAIKYFEKSAKLGNSDSMYEYGKMLYIGRCVKSDVDEGLRFISKSLIQKNKKALKFYNIHNDFVYAIGDKFKQLPPETQNFYFTQISRTDDFHIISNYKDTEMLYKNQSLINPNFYSVFNFVDLILFEIKYPSNSFNDIANTLNSLKIQSPLIFKICLLIDGPRNLSCIFGSNDIFDEIKINTPTKHISENVFFDFLSLTKVTFPETLQTIGKNSFGGCKKLEKINLPQSVRSIEINSFLNCLSLKEFVASKTIINQLCMHALHLKKLSQFTNALLYFKLAADQGDINAICNYGIMLYEGLGVSANHEESIRYLKMAIEKGNSDAMHYYGLMLLKGNDVPVNEEEACRYLKAAVDNGNINSMVEYGNCLRFGKGIQINYKGALECYKKAAEKGNTNGLVNYGLMLLDGVGVEQNYKLACDYFKKALKKGNVRGMVFYGDMLKDGLGVAQNYKEACKYYKMASEKGNTHGIVNYGNMLRDGLGVKQNYKEAIKYYKIASEKGNTNGMINCGNMYNDGLGIPIDYKEAFTYYKRAADGGNKNGMVKSGLMLKKGLGVRKNYEEASKYFKMAADENELSGILNYGLMLKDGLGVPKNNEEASKFFKMAADKNDLIGILNYGLMLKDGLGVPKNNEEAGRYFKIAADKGNSDGIFEYGCFLLTSNNYNEAIKYFKISSEQNNYFGMIYYSFMLENGFGIEADHEKALKYIEFLIENCQANIIYNFSELLMENANEFPNKEMNFVRYCKIAADASYSEAQYKLGTLYYEGKYVVQNTNKSIHYLTLSSNQNNSNAQYYLGKIYYECKLVKININKSIYYLTLSANQGNLSAQYLLAKIYYESEFVHNLSKSIHFLTLSSKNHCPQLAFLLGLFYSDNKNVKRDMNKAIQSYEIASNHKYSFALNNLGVIYKNGYNIEKNLHKAYNLFKEAIKLNNDPVSAYNLVSILIFSRHTIKIDESIKYITKSLDLIFDISVQLLSLVLVLKFNYKIQLDSIRNELNKYSKIGDDQISKIFIYIKENDLDNKKSFYNKFISLKDIDYFYEYNNMSPFELKVIQSSVFMSNKVLEKTKNDDSLKKHITKSFYEGFDIP